MVKEFTPQELTTIYYYNLTAQNWSGEHANTSFWAKELTTFQRFLPQGSILEVGSGGGRDAKLLSTAGYNYIGVDVSTQLLEEARSKNPHLTFLPMSVYQLGFKPNSFDGFWCAATILHLPKDKASLALENIHEVVRPKAKGFITVKEGYGDMIPEEEVISGVILTRHFSYYQPDEFSHLLDKNHYKILGSQRRVDSPRSTWLIYYVETQK